MKLIFHSSCFFQLLFSTCSFHRWGFFWAVGGVGFSLAFATEAIKASTTAGRGGVLSGSSGWETQGVKVHGPSAVGAVCLFLWAPKMKKTDTLMAFHECVQWSCVPEKFQTVHWKTVSPGVVFWSSSTEFWKGKEWESLHVWMTVIKVKVICVCPSKVTKFPHVMQNSTPTLESHQKKHYKLYKHFPQNTITKHQPLEWQLLPRTSISWKLGEALSLVNGCCKIGQSSLLCFWTIDLISNSWCNLTSKHIFCYLFFTDDIESHGFIGELGKNSNESQHRAPTDSKRTDQQLPLEVQNGALVGVESTGSLLKVFFWDVTLNPSRLDILKWWTINWKKSKVFLALPPFGWLPEMVDPKAVPYWNSLPHRPGTSVYCARTSHHLLMIFRVFKEQVSQRVMLANEKKLGFKFEPSC